MQAIDRDLEEIERLRQGGDHETRRTLALSLVSRHPEDPRAHLAAAYAQDRLGNDLEAIKHYEQALHLGVPEKENFDLVVSFASTLRNVGRHEESAALLSRALRENPQSPALMAFMSLTLHSSGQADAALAMMLKAALTAAQVHGIDGYERALTEYHEELDAAARLKSTSIP